jgi:F-type H+-transporting ATPase subunit b
VAQRDREAMLIDWFTVGAQLLNFFVLVWLLKRFLYQPIVDAIDAREQRIAAELAAAAAQQAEAQAQREALTLKQETFERERAALLQKAEDNARAEHQRLLQAARDEADDLRARREDALRRELRDLQATLRHRTQREVFAIARKTLSELASQSLEQCLVELFNRRLRELDAATRAELLTHFTKEHHILVRTAFDISPPQRDSIQRTLGATFNIPVTLRYETVPDLIVGIEISTQGKKLVWSITDYLSSMEQALEAVLPPSTQSTAVAITGAKES